MSSDLVSNELSYDVNTSVNDQSTCRVCDVPGKKTLQIHKENISWKPLNIHEPVLKLTT